MSNKPNMNHGKRQRPRAVRPAQERLATGSEPDISEPEIIENDFVDAPEPDEDIRRQQENEYQQQQPVNPYAPTGWGKESRVEFDVRLPDKTDPQTGRVKHGQLCRMMRLEREDLLRLNVAQYLDTFTPMLMSNLPEEQKSSMVEEKLKSDPVALTKMFEAMDIVVMAACLNPRITNDATKVNYGTNFDHADPKFVATVPIHNIDLEDRTYLFGMAFGRSMDDLKSLFEQKNSVGSVENKSGV